MTKAREKGNNFGKVYKKGQPAKNGLSFVTIVTLGVFALHVSSLPYTFRLYPTRFVFALHVSPTYSTFLCLSRNSGLLVYCWLAGS